MSSTLYDHALNFYEALAERASMEKIEEEVELLVFRGSITQAWRSLNVSQAYYSQVRKALIELGCISVVNQGARNRESVVALHHAPDADEFQVTKDRLTPNLSVARLTQQVENLTRLVGGIHVVEALADHEKRLREVEREVKRIGKEPPKPSRRTA